MITLFFIVKWLGIAVLVALVILAIFVTLAFVVAKLFGLDPSGRKYDKDSLFEEYEELCAEEDELQRKKTKG